MQDEQFAFLADLNDKPRSITYTTTKTKDDGTDEKIDTTVWVKPVVLAFNFSVQQLDATIDALGGARNKKKNEESFALLRKAVDAKIEALDQAITSSTESPEKDALELERNVIRELSNQLYSMVDEHNVYTPIDNDRYGFASRLNLLCYKIGITVMIHCKSGKDRTARLIEETKLLAIQVEEKKKEPKNVQKIDSQLVESEPDSQLVPKAGKLSFEQQILLLKLSMNSGNDTIQENCTGSPGNKQHATLKERILDLLNDDTMGQDARGMFERYKARPGTEA